MKILIGKHHRDDCVCVAEADPQFSDDAPYPTEEDAFSIKKESIIGQWIISKLDNDTFERWGWRVLDLGND